MTQYIRCPYYESTSPKYPNMRCGHYHSGTERLTFESREQLYAWKTDKCFDDFKSCPYFNTVWILIVSADGRDYWKRVTGRAVNAALNEALQEIVTEIAVLKIDKYADQEVAVKLKVRAMHSIH